jgi:hypothetical protein
MADGFLFLICLKRDIITLHGDFISDKLRAKTVIFKESVVCIKR